jgi:hypothetical protein
MSSTSPSNPGSNKYRNYSECGPHGDLKRLVMRCRAWSRYIPEISLLHVLYAVANDACEMLRTPWLTMENLRDDWSVKV